MNTVLALEGGDSRIEISTLTKDQKALHIALKKETVAEDTANNNTSITSRVSQTTLSDFSKNFEDSSPTENEEAIDDQTRSVDSYEIQCEKEYWSDLHKHRYIVPSGQDREGTTRFSQRIQRQTQQIRDEAGECHRHTPVRDFDHRSRRTDGSQTYW